MQYNGHARTYLVSVMQRYLIYCYFTSQLNCAMTVEFIFKNLRLYIKVRSKYLKNIRYVCVSRHLNFLYGIISNISLLSLVWKVQNTLPDHRFLDTYATARSNGESINAQKLYLKMKKKCSIKAAQYMYPTQLNSVYIHVP